MNEEAKKIWRKHQKLEPFALTWPKEGIKTDDGQPFDGTIICKLPLDAAERRKALRQMVERTKAFAFVLIENLGTRVRVLLESEHGTRVWSTPIAWHGDVRVLERTTDARDAESEGLLWRPQGPTN